MADAARPRDFPPPFNQFAQMQGCDARGENPFPLAVNVDNVEAVGFFNSVAGDPGDILQIHFVSGQSLYARNISPAAAERSAQGDPAGHPGIIPRAIADKPGPFPLPPSEPTDPFDRGGRGHSYSKADTVAAQDAIPVPRSEADSYDR